MESDIIGKTVTVTVDRSLGSHHPLYKELYYPVNYGYIKGIMAPDGEEQDAYILGVDTPIEEFTGKVVAVIHRKDDVEDKWVVCPKNMTFTREQIMEQVRFQEQYFEAEIVLETEEVNDTT
ncbi:MAG: inorganic pyrophosphatase [Bacteroidales bacterium]|nr:inorganic pyrophosphatase [Bacteroidales bacterium]